MASANGLQFWKVIITVPIITAHDLFSAQSVNEYVYVNVCINLLKRISSQQTRLNRLYLPSGSEVQLAFPWRLFTSNSSYWWVRSTRFETLRMLLRTCFQTSYSRVWTRCRCLHSLFALVKRVAKRVMHIFCSNGLGASIQYGRPIQKYATLSSKKNIYSFKAIKNCDSTFLKDILRFKKKLKRWFKIDDVSTLP